MQLSYGNLVKRVNVSLDHRGMLLAIKALVQMGPKLVQSSYTSDIWIKFALKHDLYLVVKNTGHDHLDRSSGRGAFAIWTHNLKGKEWNSSFVPQGAPLNVAGIPAVTLQTGEQWQDVYKAAAEQGVIVVGGAARTVGSAGGYMTDGGHGPFSHFYGLAVDNVLEVKLIDAKGRRRILNQYTNPEYFYAIRGGGSARGAWFNSMSPPPLHWADEPAGFAAIFIQPNATNTTFIEAFREYRDISKIPGVSGITANFDFPSWIEYSKVFIQDPHIASNTIDESRLLTSDVLLSRTDDIVGLMMENVSNPSGFNFIGKVNPAERDNTATHPAWKYSRALLSFSANWKDDASADEKRRAQLQLVEISKKFSEIVGPDGGTYLNEANP
ncbi:hypothetical protein LOY94_002710 [Ophidiomyces ophidiicola]|nr:hypothetical protein LOZ62_001273 [Ophidiomyces ophidiicola]KAI1962649.1 hypothetical protein LOZ59_001982 [Ophidiomyces ophidiicola]KAI1973522.1 hypothetical protein LOZ56_001788 [Ophidiomyces ophidiicola]KAI2039826.1 hypothetical protein LOZ47_001909 [Ophidiomyces ophidiicola]KAI2058289.1 hypothetical protein LOZ44_001073 [Ophidiomyces ophidiicola]